MKNLKSITKKLWEDESGQGATEYILLLVVVVGLAMMFRTEISDIVRDKIGELGRGIGSFSVN